MGKHRKLSTSDAEDLRWLYFRGTNKNGKRHTIKEVATIYSICLRTALDVIDRKRAYSDLKESLDDIS